jgi:putative addiction module component (TIGR02574 family)
MTRRVDELKNELLQLSAEDRAELADYLICSLGEEDGGDVQSVSEAELGRRLQDMENGTVGSVPAEDVFAAMRKKYP